LRDFLVSEKYNKNTWRFLILKGSSPYFDLNFLTHFGKFKNRERLRQLKPF
jgi:hypothetical protein